MTRDGIDNYILFQNWWLLNLLCLKSSNNSIFKDKYLWRHNIILQCKKIYKCKTNKKC